MRLSLLSERLQDLPQAELRALFDSLQLQIAFQPQTRTIDVEVTLVADEPPDRDGETSQVWVVPSGGVGPDLRRLVRLASGYGFARTAQNRNRASHQPSLGIPMPNELGSNAAAPHREPRPGPQMLEGAPPRYRRLIA